MKQYKLQDIRNIGFVGHGGSGKTSLAESVLFFTDVSDRLGKVGDTSSIMDYDPDEIKRGHSINSSVAFCEFNSTKISSTLAECFLLPPTFFPAVYFVFLACETLFWHPYHKIL